jgi:hypothetical protein
VVRAAGVAGWDGERAVGSDWPIVQAQVCPSQTEVRFRCTAPTIGQIDARATHQVFVPASQHEPGQTVPEQGNDAATSIILMNAGSLDYDDAGDQLAKSDQDKFALRIKPPQLLRLPRGQDPIRLTFRQRVATRDRTIKRSVLIETRRSTS